MLDYIGYKIDVILKIINIRAQKYKLKRYVNINVSAMIGSNVQFIGPYNQFYIGEKTYINNAILSAGSKSKIKIGSRCSIGYRVSIKAITHNVNNPCIDDDGVIEHIEKDIVIGESCWIGDNVYIREGITLGDNVVVGANAVVTKSFPDNVVIAGVPARIISPFSQK